MLDNLIYSANAVMPIFLLFALGYILKAIGFLKKEFIDGCDKFVFRIALPCLVFTQLAFSQNKVLSGTDVLSIIFCSVSIVVLVFGLILLCPLIIKSSASRGAFIQGAFRSNFSVLGLPLSASLFGDDGTRIASFMLACAVPIYNILAVVILSINNPDKKQILHKQKTALSILKDIAANPLIIAVIFAIPFFVFKLDMPNMFKQSITYIADTATPIALLSIGAGFDFSKLKGKVSLSVSCVFLKMLVIPLLFVVVAAALGFRNEHLGLVFIVFGSPTAISSYTMAKSMNSDHQLASQILLLTSITSVFSIFFGSFILKQIGLI